MQTSPAQELSGSPIQVIISQTHCFPSWLRWQAQVLISEDSKHIKHVWKAADTRPHSYLEFDGGPENEKFDKVDE